MEIFHYDVAIYNDSLTKTWAFILITVIVLGFNGQVVAQVSSPNIYVDAPSTVVVSTEFDIIISIRDIPDGWGMVRFVIVAQWDPNDLEYIECEFLGSGRLGTWDGGCGGLALFPGSADGAGNGPRWTEDAAWLRFRFHCLREGSAPITILTKNPPTPSPPPTTSAIDNLEEAPDTTITLKDDSGALAYVAAESVTVTVNQVEPAPVGGISTPISKLAILTPYLALAGLIAVVSAVYVIKRRKD